MMECVHISLRWMVCTMARASTFNWKSDPAKVSATPQGHATKDATASAQYLHCGGGRAILLFEKRENRPRTRAMAYVNDMWRASSLLR